MTDKTPQEQARTRASDPEAHRRKPHGTTLSAQDARQSEIILRRRATRAIFVAGLAAFALVALLLTLLGRP